MCKMHVYSGQLSATLCKCLSVVIAIVIIGHWAALPLRTRCFGSVLIPSPCGECNTHSRRDRAARRRGTAKSLKTPSEDIRDQLAQLLIFKKYDFNSMYAFRLVYYLFWHIGWGHLRLRLLF